METQQNEQPNSKQRSFHRLLQLYYNHNLANLSNSLKRCIPDMDFQIENRYIKKNDKIWVQINLNKIFLNASDKLQRNQFSRNLFIKNSIQRYQTQFQRLNPQLKQRIILQTSNISKKSFSKNIIKRRTLSKSNNRKKTIFYQQNLISEPSISNQITIQRNSLTSKRTFRVRQFRKNLDQIVNNARYMQKLQRVKLQSTFTQFYFQKDSNPEDQWKQFQNQPKIINKLKAMTNIRCNFINSQTLSNDKHIQSYCYEKKTANFFNYRNTQSFLNDKKDVDNNQKINNLLGLQIKKENLYKPKSKCRQRKNKIFLNL